VGHEFENYYGLNRVDHVGNQPVFVTANIEYCNLRSTGNGDTGGFHGGIVPKDSLRIASRLTGERTESNDFGGSE
jgi:hypothetical protein